MGDIVERLRSDSQRMVYIEGINRGDTDMVQKIYVPLDDEELDTILAIARNRQSGRITEYEIKELVSIYRQHFADEAERDYREREMYSLEDEGQL